MLKARLKTYTLHIYLYFKVLHIFIYEYIIYICYCVILYIIKAKLVCLIFYIYIIIYNYILKINLS